MGDKDYYDELFFKSLPKLLGFGAAFLVGALLCIIIGGLLTGCTTYVPVETVRTEYRHSTDTLRQTDSIIKERETIIREANSGDSALLASYGFRLKENERLLLFLQKELEREKGNQEERRTDTLIKNDTIRVPYPVEGKVPKWEQVKLVSTGAVGGVCVLGIVGITLWLRRRYRRLDCT